MFLDNVAFFFSYCSFILSAHPFVLLNCTNCADLRVETVNAGHVCCILITQDKIWLRLQMISPSVSSKKLRSQPWTGLVVSQWPGFLYKLLKIFKVWWLIVVCILLLLHFLLSFFFPASHMCMEGIIFWLLHLIHHSLKFEPFIN